MPAALSYVYATEADVLALIGAEGEQGRLDDDGSGTVSAGEQAYLTKALSWASGRVNQHCLGRYEASELAASWVVSWWATVIAAYWLCCRRGNPAAGSIKSLYEEAMAELKSVQSGEQPLADAATRASNFPSWSNVTVDRFGHVLRRIRVQRATSDRHDEGQGNPRNYDLLAEHIPRPL